MQLVTGHHYCFIMPCFMNKVVLPRQRTRLATNQANTPLTTRCLTGSDFQKSGNKLLILSIYILLSFYIYFHWTDEWPSLRRLRWFPFISPVSDCRTAGGATSPVTTTCVTEPFAEWNEYVCFRGTHSAVTALPVIKDTQKEQKNICVIVDCSPWRQCKQIQY